MKSVKRFIRPRSDKDRQGQGRGQRVRRPLRGLLRVPGGAALRAVFHRKGDPLRGVGGGGGGGGQAARALWSPPEPQHVKAAEPVQDQFTLSKRARESRGASARPCARERHMRHVEAAAGARESSALSTEVKANRRGNAFQTTEVKASHQKPSTEVKQQKSKPLTRSPQQKSKKRSQSLSPEALNRSQSRKARQRHAGANAP